MKQNRHAFVLKKISKLINTNEIYEINEAVLKS